MTGRLRVLVISANVEGILTLRRLGIIYIDMGSSLINGPKLSIGRLKQLISLVWVILEVIPAGLMSA